MISLLDNLGFTRFFWELSVKHATGEYRERTSQVDCLLWRFNRVKHLQSPLCQFQHFFFIIIWAEKNVGRQKAWPLFTSRVITWNEIWVNKVQTRFQKVTKIETVQCEICCEVANLESKHRQDIWMEHPKQASINKCSWWRVYRIFV